MLKRIFENLSIRATDWWFRVTTIERFLLTAAFGVIVAVFATSPLIAFILHLLLGVIPEEYVKAKNTLDTVAGTILAICIVVIVVALALSVFRFLGDAKARSKRRVLVIEGRGLRDDDGSPLVDAVSGELIGQRIPLLLDLRNGLDGKVIEPESALKKIVAMHNALLQHKGSIDRSELTVIYGGLTSVPYTFLTGVLLDDEGAIETYDWDRTQEAWRQLNDQDDGASFEVEGLDWLPETQDVVLALGFSYPIVSEDIATTFEHPVVRLTLKELSSDAHWSNEKQNRHSQQFIETLKQLAAKGVKKIHLVMAAPNSVVCTFGRRYDKRNLPEVVVYQYQRNAKLAYPWGVQMPVAGTEDAKVVYRKPLHD